MTWNVTHSVPKVKPNKLSETTTSHSMWLQTAIRTGYYWIQLLREIRHKAASPPQCSVVFARPRAMCRPMSRLTRLPKLQIDRFSHFCTAAGRVSLGTMEPPGEYDWICAHWRNLTNTVELVLSWAHPSPQPKRQIDRFSRFITYSHGKKFLYFTMGAHFSPNCPVPLGI